jgi:hypothetical protein
MNVEQLVEYELGEKVSGENPPPVALPPPPIPYDLIWD